jgi:hypothetical protein
MAPPLLVSRAITQSCHKRILSREMPAFAVMLQRKLVLTTWFC